MSQINRYNTPWNQTPQSPLKVSIDFQGTSEYPWSTATALSSGTQASGSSLATMGEHPGQVTYSSAASTTGSGYTRSLATESILLSGGETSDIIIRTPTSINANSLLYVGYLDQTTAADATDGVYFYILGTAIYGKTASNSNRSTTAQIATLSANTWYRIRLEVNSDATSVTYYVYDSATNTLLGSASLTTNIPTTRATKHGYVVYINNAFQPVTELMTFDYMDMGKEKYLAR